MPINSTLNRLLADPDSRERAVLQSDLTENILEGSDREIDLDTRIIGIHKNTNQRLIIVTQDKALLTLKRNIAQLGKKEWIAPLSTVTTILLALITSNFKFALGLGPAEWRAIFIVCGFIATGWLAASVKRSLGSKAFHEVIANTCYELGAREKCEVPVRKKPRSTFTASNVVSACKTHITQLQKKKVKSKK